MKEGHDIVSRYESKFLIPGDMVPALREYVSAFCSPDKFAGPDGTYVINNLYFETPEMRFYLDTRLKRFERFKPRCRFYGDGSDGYLWLELKHKLQNVTWKIRRRIPVTQWEKLFESTLDPASDGAKRVKVVESFEDAVIAFGAAPFLFVKYVREPYVSDVSSYGRITFDRQLSYCVAGGSAKLQHGRPYIFYDDVVTAKHADDESPVLLEIKTETNVPLWVIDMIRIFNLSRRGFSKYCQAVDHHLEYLKPDERTSVFEPARRLFS